MNNMISVAMTTYNGEKYLREQLDSLYSQTILPDEIIVVDDCSTDDTHKILEEYHNKKGLVYIINERNLGVNKNFEKAISLCRGDYIAISDQDDVWFPEKIEITYNKIREIENGQPSVVSSNRIGVDENLNIISSPSSKVDSFHFSTTLLGHLSQGCTLMMNRELISYILPFPESGKMLYDIYIGLTAAMIGNKYNLSVPLMYYRHHDNNVCGRIFKKPSLYKRLKIRYSQRYPGLIREGRFHNMDIVADYHSSNFHLDRVKMFNLLLLLDKTDEISKKIKIIQSIDYLSKKRKRFLKVETVISHYYLKFLKRKTK